MRIYVVRAYIEPKFTVGLIYYYSGRGPGLIVMDHRCFWNLVEGFGNPVGHKFDYEDGVLIPVEGG